MLKKPGHGRRFSKRFLGIIRPDILEYNFEETECIKQLKSAENRDPNLETLILDV